MITLKTEAIGLKKPVDIKVTIKRRREANAMMIEMLKWDLGSNSHGPISELTDESSAEEVTKAVIAQRQQDEKALDDTIDFIANILKLTKRQRETVEDTIDDVEAAQYAQYVIDRINGKPEEQFEAEQKAAEDMDPKKDEQ